MTRVRRRTEHRRATGPTGRRGSRVWSAVLPSPTPTIIVVATAPDGQHPGQGQRPQRHLPDSRHARCPRDSCRWSEHGQRVKAATTATTLGDLQALVSDLQTGNAPVQLPTLKKPSAERLVGRRRLGNPRRGGRRAGAARHRDRLGALRQHPVAAELHLRSRRQVRRRGTGGADPAAATALAGRTQRAPRADEEEVRRHHGLPAGDLPGLRLAGPAGPGDDRARR